MILLALLVAATSTPPGELEPPRAIQRHLYVANSRGLTIYDISKGHSKVRSVSVKGGDFKGICASSLSDRLYLSSRQGDKVICINLINHEVLWEKSFDAGIDSIAVTPDGGTLYIACRDGGSWVVANAISGDVITRIKLDGKPNQTWCQPDGKQIFLSALGLPNVSVVNTKSNKVIRRIGPFGEAVRAFSVSPRGQKIVVNVQDLLGFEIGDAVAGTKTAQVKVKRFEPKKGRNGTFSHGIGLHPNQREVWVSNDAGKHLHVYDITRTPPKWVVDIPLSKENSWISFSLDGRYCYPSSGDVIDTGTKRVITKIPAPGKEGNENVLEVQFQDGSPFRVGRR